MLQVVDWKYCACCGAEFDWPARRLPIRDPHTIVCGGCGCEWNDRDQERRDTFGDAADMVVASLRKWFESDSEITTIPAFGYALESEFKARAKEE